jgi:putative sigma-54 modulation protein
VEFLLEARNLTVPDEAENYIREKMDKLSRRLRSIDRIRFEIGFDRTRGAEKRYVAQVTADVRDTIIRAEQRAADVSAVINAAIDAMEDRIERYKGKRFGTKRRSSSGLNNAAIEEAPDIPIRVKRFPVRQMSPDEAASQMELLGHRFFLFIDADTGEMNVIYLRDDGSYGLIQPLLD